MRRIYYYCLVCLGAGFCTGKIQKMTTDIPSTVITPDKVETPHWHTQICGWFSGQRNSH